MEEFFLFVDLIQMEIESDLFRVFKIETKESNGNEKKEMINVSIKSFKSMNYPLETCWNLSLIHSKTNEMIVTGGIDTKGKCFKINLQRMKEWKEMDSFPKGISDHCGVLIEKRKEMFVFGGFDSDSCYSMKLRRSSNEPNKWNEINSKLPFQTFWSQSHL